MRTITGMIVLAGAAWLSTATDARAELFSKAYAFKVNTTLQVGAEVPGGLRLDAVEFVLPKDDGSQGSVFSGPKAKVSISNLGTTSVTVGLVIAVTDAEGRLVGVASGGTKLFPLRAERQMVYTLDFDSVNAEIASGTIFRISIERKP